MSASDTIRWSQHDFPEPEGSITCTFRANADGRILAVNSEGSAPQLVCGIERGALRVQAVTPHAPVDLDIEDTAGVSDGAAHTLALTFGEFGARVYLDGAQCFSSTANLCPTALGTAADGTQASGAIAAGDAAVNVSDLQLHAQPLTSEQILAATPTPQPDINFAAAQLAPRDVRRVRELHGGTIYAHFRVRGPRQYGTILAASVNDKEVLAVSIDDTGITMTAADGSYDPTVYHANGVWDDGRWHDLTIRSARGAIDIYVDGWHELHQAGQIFFGDWPDITAIHIGENTDGVRLMGEVRNGGIFTTALTDGKIRKLSSAPALTTTALFDKGFHGSASYRIPSLIRTPHDVVIAGADQRVAIANDAPNHINFVIRRSLDGGSTWLDMQTVIDNPGDGIDGASAIDSCLVCDEQTGRVIVLIDRFAGGIGLPNNKPGVGVDERGRLRLYDASGAHYLLNEDGSVVHEDGTPTDYLVDEHGDVTRNGEPAGNIYLKEGVDPHESVLMERTSYVVEVHSDDDGATWSAPRNLNHMIKEEWMHFLGVSPGNGIQLQAGAHRGRLLIPFYFTGASLKHYAGGALISDDGGKTWRRGATINEGRVINGVEVDPKNIWDDDATTHESVLTERADGTVVCFFRNQNRSGRVGVALSHDGGETWDDMYSDEQIPDIFCQPNAVTCAPGSDVTVFANASQMLPYRGNGVLRLSLDGGRTWAAHRCVNPYHYVYQCMRMLPNGNLGLLWERETAGLYFTELPLSIFGIPQIG
ncbi:sialidase family protein [Bifidobacterium mongoliense]|jgi:sialidase-1|uniref:sialidase family protein n=1 Tax=Bifidobacterium mongoliense TaxID=518643 RepID=UPI0026482792|nr:sialidase family protein [Bifidobacterium mongoliense]MDN5632772.1 exo-alpha-sialidase [Bifidobacterium mongoliense]